MDTSDIGRASNVADNIQMERPKYTANCWIMKDGKAEKSREWWER